MDKNEERILERLYNVIPVGTLYMSEFLKLLDIKLTKDTNITPSACITCEVAPIMYLNIDFINEYCITDEHLFMLVMHELYHKILGHTTLFKRTTKIDNIAFDAIINSILCKIYPDECYVSFFKKLNNSRELPQALLRPPADDNPECIKHLMKELYEANTGTYFEVYEAIRNDIIDLIKNGNAVLIGNHKVDNENDEMQNSLFMKELIEKIIEKWPRPPKIISGRDLGGSETSVDFENKQVSNEVKTNIKRLLRKAGLNTGKIDKTKSKYDQKIIDIQSFLLNSKDRTIPAKNCFLNNILLYNDTINVNTITNESKQKAMVYIDVSGSVTEYLSMIAPYFKEPVRRSECELYAFSTKVFPLTYEDFKSQTFRTTGGTEINCIFDHYEKLKTKGKSKKLIILTDGYTGYVTPYNQNLISKNKIKVYCGLFAECSTQYLQQVSKEIFDITKKRIKK